MMTAFRYCFQPNQSRISRFQSESDLICIFRMIKKDRICPDSVPIIPNVIRQRSDQTNSAEFPDCFKQALTVGSPWPTSQDFSRSVGLCYERIGLRPENNRTFKIIQDINPIFTIFVSYRCLISNGSHNRECVTPALDKAIIVKEQD